MILETKRLYLREMKPSDFPALCRVLKEKEVMYAYEHAFDDQEVQQWLDRQMERYIRDGFGLWLVVRKDTDEIIGQCGLTMQDYNGRQVIEVGYLFEKPQWHKGYATEAACACRDYAFLVLKANEVYSIIRENNLPSIEVAKRNQMTPCGQVVKHYYGMEMPHIVYRVKRDF